jgi:hypothetical protein
MTYGFDPGFPCDIDNVEQALENGNPYEAVEYIIEMEEVLDPGELYERLASLYWWIRSSFCKGTLDRNEIRPVWGVS